MTQSQFLHHYRQSLVLGLALIIVLGAGWMIGSHFLLGSALVGGVVVGLIVLGYPEAALLASLVTIVVGQLVRLPVGSSEILPNDIILPALFFAWMLRRMASRHWELRKHSLTLPIVLMLLVMGLSLVVNLGREDTNEWLSGALYFVRWVEYLTLLWIGLDVFRTHQRAGRYLKIFMLIGVALAVLGFVQLKFFPDFSFMVPKGWDPHVGRLLSTWFDPNFLGGLFLCTDFRGAGCCLSIFPGARGDGGGSVIGIMLLATLLTFSRSAYVGLVVALGIIGLVRSRVALISWHPGHRLPWSCSCRGCKSGSSVFAASTKLRSCAWCPIGMP